MVSYVLFVVQNLDTNNVKVKSLNSLNFFKVSGYISEGVLTVVY